MKHNIKSITPVDGRYANKTKKLQDYFSEFALFRYRVMIEVEYFLALCKIPLPQLSKINLQFTEKELKKLYIDFSTEDALRIKEIERTTNHDIKATEYFVKEKFDDLELAEYKEFVHFALTSQDINNTAFPLMTKDFLSKIFYNKFDVLIDKIEFLSDAYKDIQMLSRTHGQAATPTKIGKEFFVFVERLKKQKLQLEQIQLEAKFGGATGNFNAHKVAYPNTDWKRFANNFIYNLGLYRQQTTTQIEHYDNLSALFHSIERINTILLDLTKDIWHYISIDYFKQKIKDGEVGSSAMPHKVNPIDFENAEGNLGLANAIFSHLASKLPISRLQRDLTDSTVLRNIGVPFAHTIIAFDSIMKGLEKLKLNKKKINEDLQNNWAVVAEAIQTILRREKYPKAYEVLKELTRKNTDINEQAIKKFIKNLNVADNVKTEMLSITPFNY